MLFSDESCYMKRRNRQVEAVGWATNLFDNPDFEKLVVKSRAELGIPPKGIPDYDVWSGWKKQDVNKHTALTIRVHQHLVDFALKILGKRPLDMLAFRRAIFFYFETGCVDPRFSGAECRLVSDLDILLSHVAYFEEMGKWPTSPTHILLEIGPNISIEEICETVRIKNLEIKSKQEELRKRLNLKYNRKRPVSKNAKRDALILRLSHISLKDLRGMVQNGKGLRYKRQFIVRYLSEQAGINITDGAVDSVIQRKSKKS